MSYKKSISFFKETVFAQIILIIIAGILIFTFNWSFKSILTLDGGDAAFATMVFYFSEEERMFQGDVLERMTILDALNASAGAGKIELRYKIDENGDSIVTEINGHSSLSNGNDFYFYLNSERVETKDISKIFINRGDKIEVKFN